MRKEIKFTFLNSVWKEEEDNWLRFGDFKSPDLLYEYLVYVIVGKTEIV